MKFIDSINLPNSGTKYAGLQYISECGGWRVTASNMWDAETGATGPAEWFAWSLARDGHAVRRMPWARFVVAEQAAAAAALCEAVTLSAVGRAVTSATYAAGRLRDGMADRLRGMGTLGIFAGMRLAHAAAEAARDFARRQSGAKA